MTGTGVGLIALSWAVACPVLAQKAVLGPADAQVGGEPVRKLASDALGEALRMQGFTVILFEDAKTAVPRGQSCDDACASRLLRAVSADVSALVKILPDTQNMPAESHVLLLDAAGHHFDGSAAVRDGDVRDATTRALLEARSYQLLGPGPWLSVDGTPAGADVLIDGNLVGKLPYRASVAAGSHELVVREAGYSRYNKALEVPADDSEKLQLRVALEPAVIEAPSAALELPVEHAAESSNEASDRTWLAIPIAMGVVGVGLAAATTVRIASGVDSCAEPDAANRCTSRSGVRAWPTLGAYTLSAGLIGAGVVWLVLGLQNERPAVSASVGLNHIAVSGSF